MKMNRRQTRKQRRNYNSFIRSNSNRFTRHTSKNCSPNNEHHYHFSSNNMDEMRDYVIKNRIDSENRLQKICEGIAENSKLDFPKECFSSQLIDNMTNDSLEELYTIREKIRDELIEAFKNIEGVFIERVTSNFLPLQECYHYRDMLIEHGIKRHDYINGKYNPSDEEKKIYNRMSELELEMAYGLAWHVKLLRGDSVDIDDTNVTKDFFKRISNGNEMNMDRRIIELGYNMFSDIRHVFPKCDFEEAYNNLFFNFPVMHCMLKACSFLDYEVFMQEEFYDYFVNHFLDETKRKEFNELYRKYGREKHPDSVDPLSEKRQHYVDYLTRITFEFAKYTLQVIYD